MELSDFVPTIITIVVVMAVMLGTCAYLIWVERKIAAYVQDRLGPNRVGPYGLFQPIADGLKFLFKEDIIPNHVDRLLFLAAPAIAVTTALLAFAVVPFGATDLPPPPQRPLPSAGAEDEQYKAALNQYKAEAQAYREKYYDRYQFVIAPHVDIGIVFIFAVTSLTVYAIILGGWSANSKYSFIGGVRSSAQLVSYEIPMGMSILGVVLISRSLNLERIIQEQASGGVWFIWYQPVGFLLFLVSAFAECNRLPFDLPEAEQELVGGYHTEYSALKFGLFFVGEYTHMVTTSFLMVILFFGGWYFPWVAETDSAIALKIIVFLIKVTGFVLFYMLIRWTLPRFRFDQLMGLAWKVLIPLALANLVCVLVVKEITEAQGWQDIPIGGGWVISSEWVLLPVSLVLLFVTGWLGAQVPAGRGPRLAVRRPEERVQTMAPS
jgi:NADH-quinone oxidoreductase subunit H